MSPKVAEEAAYTVLAVSLGALISGLTFWSFRSTDPMWAVISFVIVYDPDLKAAISAGLARFGLTIMGSVLALAAVFTFGLHKWLLPVSLAIATIVCSFFLPQRASWRLVLVTVTVIVGSSLLQPTEGPTIAVTRSIEVTFGSLLAIAISWLVARIRSGSVSNDKGRPEG